jgi:hypothetical protein
VADIVAGHSQKINVDTDIHMVLLLRHVSSLGKGTQQSLHAPANRIQQTDNLLFSLGGGREGE